MHTILKAEFARQFAKRRLELAFGARTSCHREVYGVSAVAESLECPNHFVVPLALDQIPRGHNQWSAWNQSQPVLGVPVPPWIKHRSIHTVRNGLCGGGMGAARDGKFT